ncbi:hypothetical protein GGR56DRAFT_70131 [Xylariaceae sp. FL0804]|nr:hypothetical protein GGR56DRAFT_70131 [Xylariaceae sp. FL0804]
MTTKNPTCQALNLSDGKPCNEAAEVWDNLFCRFHGKQCHGLYAGYKRRNARLDVMSAKAPAYLKTSSTPLANELFEDVADEKTLQEIHGHLYSEYVLLRQVIDARKLHHKHFYPLEMDYGHQAYLDTLSSRRHIVLRALEALEKRTAQVLYEQEKWFDWVRNVQMIEETRREKEAKKVKLEAAMFKRHWKKMEVRLRAKREKEEKRRQDAFLESAYQERMNAPRDTDEDAEMWDPIEDLVEDEHARYVDLIKHFLWLEMLSDEYESADGNVAPECGSATGVEKTTESGNGQPKKSKKKPKSKAAKAASLPIQSKSKDGAGPPRERHTGQDRIMDMLADKALPSNKGEPDKSNIETEEEMRKRLKEGVEKNYDDVGGPMVVGSLEMPHGTYEKTSPMADDEVDDLMRDIKEIKLLLFCRLLLSHASVLPAALRSKSVDEFLRDPEITETELRDICLKVEQPSLQDIRDACADLIRGDEPDDDEEEEEVEAPESLEEIFRQDTRFRHLQEPAWFIDKIMGTKELEPLPHKETAAKPKKMKVQVCGKSIWNYSSEKSMSRDGWLQFSVMAKDCNMKHAVELCRNWDEFSQLNFLTVWQYFPASNWVSWGTDRLTQQLHELGFFPFFKDLGASQRSHHHQVGARSHHRRQHNLVEARNIVVGHMKRKDSVTRRFLQYCSMRTGELVLLVRDGRTGKVITGPGDAEALWTLRSKQGIGRASKNEWKVHLKVGFEYFDRVDRLRDWRLGFDDYFEVWIWDLVPANSPIRFYNVIYEELRNARRVRKHLDIYQHREPFLRTLTRNMETMRVRSIKPGEQVETLWDRVHDPRNTFYQHDLSNGKTNLAPGKMVDQSQHSPYLFYTEANEVEDAVLFADESSSPNRDVVFKEVSNSIARLDAGTETMFRNLSEQLKDFERRRGPLRSSMGDLMNDFDDDWDDEDEDDDFMESDGEFEYVLDDEVEDRSEVDFTSGQLPTHWTMPEIWDEAVEQLTSGPIDPEKTRQLKKVGLLGAKWDPKITQSKEIERLMIMERDRGAALVEGFHNADLEPGAQEKYHETCEILDAILGLTPDRKAPEWAWFIVEVIDWLGLRTDYKDYTQDGRAGWPHPFIAQDVVRAWAAMAISFPNLKQSSPVTRFFQSWGGKKYRDSLLHKPVERAQTLPDIRTATSFRYRPKKFWDEWEQIQKDAKAKDTFYADAYPMEWSVAIRPILAKLYLAGVIHPATIQNSPQVVPGFAVAGTETHRPGKLDLFIDYSDKLQAQPFPKNPPGLVQPDQFPDLLRLARDFAAQHAGKHGKSPRFAILRTWSAPHFYPAMLGDASRIGLSFLDPAARSWIWKFIPKDMPVSEWSMYNNLELRLDTLAHLFKDRVRHRAETILVMGEDEQDLFRYVTAVTFAIQTKPWHREIDLWKSFVNVPLEVLEGLDPYWLN